jgi:hypothetical protein
MLSLLSCACGTANGTPDAWKWPWIMKAWKKTANSAANTVARRRKLKAAILVSRRLLPLQNMLVL